VEKIYDLFYFLGHLPQGIVVGVSPLGTCTIFVALEKFIGFVVNVIRTGYDRSIYLNIIVLRRNLGRKLLLY
jgi:hypothetical protein